MSSHAAATPKHRFAVRILHPGSWLHALGPVVWLVCAMAASGAALFFGSAVHLTPLDAPLDLPWWALAAMFFVTEILIVHVVFRAEAHSVTLGEIPLVLGLIFAAPADLVAGAVVGLAAAQIVRRQRAIKFGFNLSLTFLEAALALVIFHAVAGNAESIATRVAVAALLATAVVAIVGMILISVAIWLSDGRPGLRALLASSAFGMAATGANTSFALVGACIVWMAPETTWLLIAPAGTLLAAYRAYVGERAKRDALAFLYETTNDMHAADDTESALVALLGEAREMFRAEIAEVVLYGPGEEGRTFRTRLDGSAEKEVMVPVSVGAIDTGELHLRARSGAFLQPRGRGAAVRDGIAAPLAGENGVVGTMLVANRRGDVAAYETHDLRLFQTLANHASLALERNRLEQSLAQLTELEEELQQAQKLEAVGRLAGGVAHEFNNMLTAIIGATELLRRGLDEDDSKRRPVDEIRQAADRAASVTRQLLAFSRGQPATARMLDLNTIVEELELMLRRLIGEEIELVSSLDPDLGRVLADQTQIEQVLVNLAVNARDAMDGGGGRLTIATQNVDVSDDAGLGVAAGRWVVLSVSDTGIGMDERTRGHVFEPFFTTKEIGKGTGLGLASVYGIVAQSRGHIRLETELGRGARFDIFLPRVEPELHAVPAHEAA